MFNEKKSGGLPDLPPARYSFDSPSIDDSEDEEDDGERHALPAFPDTPGHNRFSEAAIKGAVEEDELPELPESEELPELPDERKIGGSSDNVKVIEMEEWEPEFKAVEKEYPKHIEVPRREDFLPKGRDAGSPDVFVKIDKFRSARKTFNDVRTKLDEIDDLVKKIRETKMREEQELSGWERDVANIKSRVGDVAEDIFGKVD
jgi:hypothetical protein